MFVTRLFARDDKTDAFIFCELIFCFYSRKSISYEDYSNLYSQKLLCLDSVFRVTKRVTLNLIHMDV